MLELYLHIEQEATELGIVCCLRRTQSDRPPKVEAIHPKI